jgi:hypothetical protein
MTAVEWLVDQILNNKGARVISTSTFYIKDELIEQAKEMEKQQLEKCAIYFTNYAIDTIEGKKEINGEKEFEQYYNETFKNK